MSKECERRLLAKDIKTYARIINLKSIKVKVKYMAVMEYNNGSRSAYILYFKRITKSDMFQNLIGTDNDGCNIKMNRKWIFYKVPQDTLICRILDPENLNI